MATTATLHKNPELQLPLRKGSTKLVSCILSPFQRVFQEEGSVLATVYITIGDLGVTVFSLILSFPNFLFFFLTLQCVFVKFS